MIRKFDLVFIYENNCILFFIQYENIPLIYTEGTSASSCKATKFSLCLAPMIFGQGGIFIVPYLQRHGLIRRTALFSRLLHFAGVTENVL